MNQYYKIVVLYFDKYEIYGSEKLYKDKNCCEEIIAKKVLNGYKEIVTNAFIPERKILYKSEKECSKIVGTYITTKRIINEILKRGYIIGIDIEYYNPIRVKNINEIKIYLNNYDVNKFPKMLQKIQIIKCQQKQRYVSNNEEITEENVKKLVKEYKYREEE